MSKARVLIVDDEPDYLSIIQERIESWGYEAVKAQGGKQALAIIEENLADIVILDYFMPGMDGVTVLKEIRRLNKDLAVIMLTAHPDVKGIKSAQELGVSSFISKLSHHADTMVSLKAALEISQKQIRPRKVNP